MLLFSLVSSVQSVSCVQLFATPGLQHTRLPCPSPAPGLAQTHAHRVSDAIKPSILCHPLFLPPSNFPRIRVFSNESVLRINKYFAKVMELQLNISSSNEYLGLIFFRFSWFDLFAVQGFSRVFSDSTVQKHQFFSTQLSLWSNSHMYT